MKCNHHPQIKWLLCVAILAAGLSISSGADSVDDPVVIRFTKAAGYEEGPLWGQPASSPQWECSLPEAFQVTDAGLLEVRLLTNGKNKSMASLATQLPVESQRYVFSTTFTFERDLNYSGPFYQVLYQGFYVNEDFIYVSFIVTDNRNYILSVSSSIEGWANHIPNWGTTPEFNEEELGFNDQKNLSDKLVVTLELVRGDSATAWSGVASLKNMETGLTVASRPFQKYTSSEEFFNKPLDIFIRNSAPSDVRSVQIHEIEHLP
jgi:hypothetical protein